MKKFDVFNRHSLLFAPLEGITDDLYRQTAMSIFPEWDMFYSEFYRIPTVGRVSKKNILEHYGKNIFLNLPHQNKNILQILTSPSAQTAEAISLINEMGFKVLDLNMGCPSNTVNSHQGGAFLLLNLETIKKVVSDIRSRFLGTFTVKMRIGYYDDRLFESTVKTLEDLGVEAITIHARTKEQMYTGIADWNYIKKAVSYVSIPIIGNGDIWTVEDIDKIFDYTNCHSIMCGRSAMKTPWLSKLYKDWKFDQGGADETYLLYERKKYIDLYFYSLLETYKPIFADQVILKRFKSLSRFLFDDFDDGAAIRSQFLRAEKLEVFLNLLNKLL